MASVLIAAPASGEVPFQGLGSSPTVPDCHLARSVSGDGRLVVGNCDLGSQLGVAWLWTQSFGLVLPEAPGPPATGNKSSFEDASHDGQTLAGWAEASPGSRQHAYRWLAAQAWLPLHPDLPTFIPPDCPECPWSSAATAISPDGRVIAGRMANVSFVFWDASAFRWSGGNVETFLHVGAFTFARPGGVTNDGAMAISVGGLGPTGVLYHVSPAGDVTNTGVRIAEPRPRISDDGNTIVGQTDPLSGSGATRAAFYWTATGGVTELGSAQAPSTTTVSSIARDVSADAAVIVGDVILEICTDRLDCQIRRAFRWTAETGMRLVSGELEHQGVDVGAWELESAWGVSADGSVIVGRGINPDGNPEAWRAVVPEPGIGLLSVAALAVLCVLRARR